MATLNLGKFIPKGVINFLFGVDSVFRNSFMLGQRGPVWISVGKPKELYNKIPELRAVIDRDASMFSNMKIYKRDKKTKKIIEDPALDLLLDNPNCTQAQNQFLKQYRSQFLTYGNQFIYRNKTKTGTYPVSLWCVSPFYLQPVLSGRLFDQVSMDGVISKYQMINTMLLGDKAYSKEFAAEDILFTRVPDLDNPIIGVSPIVSLQMPLSNIESAYKASNVAMQHVGVGIISPEGKDSIGAQPLRPDDRKNIEEQYTSDYGINDGQRRTILSNAAVKFSSMAVETVNLLLKEEINADMVAICNVLNMNPQMFLTNTTYENLRASIVQAYQDNIIPSADEFMQALSPFVGLKPNEELCASFEHLSILKENKLKGMQSIEAIVRSLTQAVEAKLLDPKQATAILATELGLSAASY
jgi:HK97 family phage portal protein